MLTYPKQKIWYLIDDYEAVYGVPTDRLKHCMPYNRSLSIPLYEPFHPLHHYHHRSEQRYPNVSPYIILVIICEWNSFKTIIPIISIFIPFTW